MGQELSSSHNRELYGSQQGVDKNRLKLIKFSPRVVQKGPMLGLLSNMALA